MLSARILARAARTQPRILQQARRLATKSVPKRAESTFVKEREAVRQHAAESSGITSPPPPLPPLFPLGTLVAANCPIELWRKLSI